MPRDPAGGCWLMPTGMESMSLDVGAGGGKAAVGDGGGDCFGGGGDLTAAARPEGRQTTNHCSAAPSRLPEQVSCANNQSSAETAADLSSIRDGLVQSASDRPAVDVRGVRADRTHRWCARC